MAKKIAAVCPGFLVAVGIALAAVFLERLLPIHLIGASVIGATFSVTVPVS